MRAKLRQVSDGAQKTASDRFVLRLRHFLDNFSIRFQSLGYDISLKHGMISAWNTVLVADTRQTCCQCRFPLKWQVSLAAGPSRREEWGVRPHLKQQEEDWDCKGEKSWRFAWWRGALDLEPWGVTLIIYEMMCLGVSNAWCNFVSRFLKLLLGDGWFSLKTCLKAPGLANDLRSN